MRWTRVDVDGQQQLGAASDDEIWCLGVLNKDRELPDLARKAVGDGDLATWIAADAETHGALGVWLAERLRDLPARPVSSVRLLAPIAHPPKNIVCVGRNYTEHALEAARFRGQVEAPPAFPVFFTKPWTAIVSPDDDIRYDPEVTSELDYEGEVAVVIGQRGRDISLNEAYDYVFGFTLLNDVTARDLQSRHSQYYKGKGLDTFAPFGPLVVTRDELPEPAELILETRVNGELRQRATLAQLIFDIPELIAVLSAAMTLEPGDILSTGTPAGVGMSFTPPKFLADGDLVEVSSPSIGVLRNRVRVEHHPQTQGLRRGR